MVTAPYLHTTAPQNNFYPNQFLSPYSNNSSCNKTPENHATSPTSSKTAENSQFNSVQKNNAREMATTTTADLPQQHQITISAYDPAVTGWYANVSSQRRGTNPAPPCVCIRKADSLFIIIAPRISSNRHFSKPRRSSSRTEKMHAWIKIPDGSLKSKAKLRMEHQCLTSSRNCCARRKTVITDPVHNSVKLGNG